MDASFSDFLYWSGDSNLHSGPTSALSKYDRDVFWAYFAYFYMNKWADDWPVGITSLGIDWSVVGLVDRSARESVFWLGSRGSHSLCHYDTYGCNMVAQVKGRKRWSLFPPEDSCFLYPTRLPHEESTVFTEVNIRRPDTTKFPDFTRARCYTVDLHPGDVLFVPRKWWHFVECLDTSISINTWIPMPEDHLERLHEFSVSKILQCISPKDFSYSNGEQQEGLVDWSWLAEIRKRACSDLSPSAGSLDQVVRLRDLVGEPLLAVSSLPGASCLRSTPPDPISDGTEDVGEDISCFLQALTHPDTINLLVEKYLLLSQRRSGKKPDSNVD